MVICIVFLVIFSVLGRFSAKYRKLAKESFECVGKMMTLRPCTSSLDQRIKTALTTRIMPFSKHIARFVYKYFAVLSWIFFISFFVSMFYTVYALANYALYGTCEPGVPASQCPINQAGSAISSILPLLTCSAAVDIYVSVIIVAVVLLVIWYFIRRTRKEKK